MQVARRAHAAGSTSSTPKLQRRHWAVAVLSGIAGLGLASSSYGQAGIFSNGSGDGTWENPANWLSDTVPNSGVNVVLDSSNTVTSTGANNTCGWLVVGAAPNSFNGVFSEPNNGGPATLNINAGTITANNAPILMGNGDSAGSGNYSGVINVNPGASLVQGGNAGVYIGYNQTSNVPDSNTTAALNVNGGTASFPNAFQVYIGGSDQSAYEAGTLNIGLNNSGGSVTAGNVTIGGGNSLGVLNISSGVMNETGQAAVGAGSNAGIVNLTGGTFNFSLQNNFNMCYNGDRATAILNVGGTGNLNMSGGILGLNMGQYWGGTSLVNQTGGNVTIGNTSIFGVTFDNGEGCQITYNLSGGTLTTPAITAFGGNTAVYTGGGPNNGQTIHQSFILNGGLLVANRNMTVPEISGSVQGYTFPYPSTNFTTTIGVGGANINTSGYTMTWATPLVGVPSDGGLNKTGAGALILSASNSFTGNINVSAGSVDGLYTTSLPNYTTSGHIKVASGAGLTLGVGGTGQFSDSTLPTVLSSVTFAGANTLGFDTSVSSATIASNITDGASGVRSLLATGGNTLTLTGSNTYTGGTLISNNTTVSVGSLAALGSTGPITFDNTAPYIQYTAANTTDYSSRFTNDPNQSFGVDTNGYNVSFASVVASSAGGFLNKIGAGTLTLAASGNSVAGFQVNGGVLDITGSLSVTGNINNFVYVANGGNFGGVANANATLIIDTNATLSITGSYNDTFVIGRDGGSGNLVQNAGSTLNSQLSIAVGASGVPITSTYNMNGGTLNLTNSANLLVGIAAGGTGIVNVGPGSNINIGLGGTLEVGLAGSPNGTVNMLGGAITVDPYSAVQLANGGGNTGSLNLSGGILTTGQVIGSGGTSYLRFNGGTLKANLANSVFISAVSSAVVLGGTSTIDNGGFGITIPQSLTHGGSLLDGGLIFQGGGITTLTGSNTYNGATNVASGTLVVGQDSALHSGNTVLVSTGATLVLPDQATESSAKLLNISGNMLVQGGNVATISTVARQGFISNWNGSTGLASIAAANDSRHLTALGVIVNDNGMGTGTELYGSIGGQSASDTDVIVKYTYYGDTNLDGTVDGADYSRIDNAYLNNKNSLAPQLTGWFNGDFNYDGVVDGSDYTLIDNAFNSQGASLATAIASPTSQVAGTGSSAIPEPATLSLMAIGALGVLRRRQRSH